MISRKVSVKKIWSLFLVVFQSEARQKNFIFARQSNGEDGRFVPRYALQSLLRLQLLRFPSLRSSWIFRAKYCLICTSLCKPTKYTAFVYKSPESAECMYKLHHDWSNWKPPSWGFKSRREQKKGQRSKETSGKIRLAWVFLTCG